MAEPVRNGYARQDLMNKSYPTRFEGENDYLGGTYEKNACGTGNCSSNGVFYADNCICINPDVYLFRCHQQSTEYQHKQDRRDRRRQCREHCLL